MIPRRQFAWSLSAAGVCLLGSATAMALALFRTSSDARVATLLLCGAIALGAGVTILLQARLFGTWSRLAALIEQSRNARSSHKLPAPFEVGGDDGPMTQLAMEWNHWLAALERFRQREAEAQLRQEQLQKLIAEHRLITRSWPLPCVIADVEEHRLIEANDAFLAAVERTREETVGATDVDLDLWPDAHARESWWHLVGEQGFVHDVECVLQSKSGTRLSLVSHAHQIAHEGNRYALIAFCDLSERMTREEHVRQEQKLEAIGRLAAGFAHDFNNILCIIQGHSSLLQSEPGFPASGYAGLRQITTAAERASTLTRQLLAFSRKQIMRTTNMDLNRTVHGMTNVLGRVLNENIRLKLDLSADVPLISADPGMLEQVIVNLAMNARDAMPLGGEMKVATAAFSVDTHYARLKPESRVGRFACLSIRDSGRGLDPTTASRIFEPFFTTKDIGKGTGMGLAAAYGIVKQHKGWIEVSSQLGKGTTFNIFLPAVEQEVKEAISDPQTPAAYEGKERVFVVEDEPGLLALVTSILERFGYRVFTANNGTHAADLWPQIKDKVDLLVTDIVMPEGVTGRELATRLRADRPELKVIFTSGYTADLTGITGEELVEGFNFVQKPYHPQKLIQTIRNRLDGQTPHHNGPSKIAA